MATAYMAFSSRCDCSAPGELVVAVANGELAGEPAARSKRARGLRTDFTGLSTQQINSKLNRQDGDRSVTDSKQEARKIYFGGWKSWGIVGGELASE